MNRDELKGKAEKAKGYVKEEAERQRREIQRREEAYRQGRLPTPVAGRSTAYSLKAHRVARSHILR